MIGVVYLDGCVFGDDLVVDLETSFFVILRFGRGCFGFSVFGFVANWLADWWLVLWSLVCYCAVWGFVWVDYGWGLLIVLFLNFLLFCVVFSFNCRLCLSVCVVVGACCEVACLGVWVCGQCLLLRV